MRVYPRIVQGLTFLNSAKHITEILSLLYKLMPLLWYKLYHVELLVLKSGVI